MFRQFRFRLLNEALPDLRSWHESLFGPAFSRLFQRFEDLTQPNFPLVPASEDKADGPSAALRELPVANLLETPVPTLRETPVATLVERPVALGGMAVRSGAPLVDLAPTTAVALMDGAPHRPSDAVPPLTPNGDSGRYQIFYLDGLAEGMVVDTGRMEIVPSHRADSPQLGAGDFDTLVLAGPFEAPTSLPAGLTGLENLLLQGGVSYDLAAFDDHVDRGGRLLIDGRDLGAGDTLRFDGGQENDGAFWFFGGRGDDIFIGGGGDDRIHGNQGADTLRGGSGADRFIYLHASESTGAGHDSLLDFDPGRDRIDLPGAVSGFDAPILAGALSAASFDGDLAATLATLGAGRAVLFAPNAGDLAGSIFLVVDANGELGYQAGEDFVFAVPGANVADLGVSTAIFV